MKLIYIDPPYNTGKDFIYHDDFRDSISNYLEVTGQIESGRKISSNTEVSGRFHTDWLNMMYTRLKLARSMLSDDGILFCSIDDIEAQRLRSMLDEIFGEENFIAQFAWRTDGNFDNQAKIKICHEYVVMYARSATEFLHPPVVDPSVPKDSKLFRPEIRNTIVKNGPKNPISSIELPAGFPADFVAGVIPMRTDLWPRYKSDAVVADSKLTNPVVIESGWSSKDLALEFIANGCKPILDAKGQETSFVISKTGSLEVVKKRSDYQSHVISVLSGFGGTQRATAQLEEMGIVFPGYPKPVDLIKYFVQMLGEKTATMMDFFGGSGPLAHAIMAQNANDGGTRRFIIVQLPELLDATVESDKLAAKFCDELGKPRNIAEITKERLRRAGEQLRSEFSDLKGDTGFRVFKLASSNIRAWEPDASNLEASLLTNAEHLVQGRNEQDVLYELLLKLGLDLCVPIETKTVAGKSVHSIGGGALIVCLADGVTRDVVEALATGIVDWHKALAPAVETRVVFKDSGFVDDVAKSNMAAILNQNGLANVRSL